MYVVIVLLVLGINTVHGRRPHHSSEYLAGALDQAVAGIAGGFTTERRVAAQRLVERGSGAVGAAETAAVIRAVPSDLYELADPLQSVCELKRRLFDRFVRLRTVRIVAIVLLVVESVYVVQGLGLQLYERLLTVEIVGADSGSTESGSTVGLVLGTVAAVVAGVLVVIGLIRLPADLGAGFGFFHHALLVSLLLTRVFQFEIEQFTTVLFVLLDLVLLAVVGGERAHLRRRD
ncbi:MAG: hypothetical protein ACRDPW_00785, partial [Mycobacteriales bacterium]